MPTAADDRIARLAAIAVVLSVAEAGLPTPIPGVKPGLANIVSMLVLIRLGWRAAAWVTLLRIVAAALTLGSLFTPAFFLSLAGGVASLLTLGVVRWLPSAWFGPVSMSLLAAFAHVGGQLVLAGAWLLPFSAVWLLLPVFSVVAWLFGLSNGLICAYLLARSDREVLQ